LRVTWTSPASDGGSAVTAYEVRATPRTPSAPALPVTTTDLAAVVPGLANGVPYDVAVVALNAAGPSLPGRAAGTPRTVPGAPSIGTATAGDGSAVVRWAAPADDGGAPVESYTVTAAPSGAAVTVPAGARSATVMPLANGVPTTFTVTAVNTAGPGTASAPSEPVTPRLPGRLAVVTQPAAKVVYGTASAVGATLMLADHVGIGGQPVELQAQVKPSTAWRRVASGTTAGDGRVTLRATLPANAALRLHHPAGPVAASDVAVRSVAVATRVTAAANATRTRLGTPVVVRGRVAPARPAGAPVQLQRYVSGGWHAVANGRMTSTTAYAVSWKPTGVGAYTLRLVKPADSAFATGSSGQWRQRVDPENAADIARAIVGNRRITLETTHESGVRDAATARQNVADVMAGRLARRSSYQNAPGGFTSVDIRLLRALRLMGTRGSVTVSEIAGGSHAPGSAHYAGRGLDISWVNGSHVGSGSAYGTVVDACRANGASRVFSPSYDPYGGHGNHVHCEWS
jgi:hypothetical protein